MIVFSYAPKQEEFMHEKSTQKTISIPENKFYCKIDAVLSLKHD